MKWFTPVWLVTKRELRDQFRDWRILFPLILLTIVFPFLMNEVARAAVEFVGQYGGTLLVDRLVPFSVLIIGFFPITISLVVALESFVGEKERGTIEPLLSTPLEDWHMYVGKLQDRDYHPINCQYDIYWYIFSYCISAKDRDAGIVCINPVVGAHCCPCCSYGQCSNCDLCTVYISKGCKFARFLHRNSCSCIDAR